MHPASPDSDGDGLDTDTTETVEVAQFVSGDMDGFLELTGGTLIGVVNGGPLVLLPSTRPAAERLVGLGDFAVRRGASVTGRRADGFYQRFQPTTG